MAGGGPSSVWRPTPADLHWQKEADKFVFESLTRVRDAAGRWAATITAVTGALGIVALIKGPDDFSKLADQTAVKVAGGGILLAVVLAVTSVYLANAARGLPRELPEVTGRTYRASVAQEVKDSVRLQGWSQWAAGLAVALLVIAVATTWFGTKKSTATLVQVAGPSGVVCGELVASGEGWLAVKPASATSAVVIPAAGIGALGPGASCP